MACVRHGSHCLFLRLRTLGWKDRITPLCPPLLPSDWTRSSPPRRSPGEPDAAMMFISIVACFYSGSVSLYPPSEDIVGIMVQCEALPL